MAPARRRSSPFVECLECLAAFLSFGKRLCLVSARSNRDGRTISHDARIDRESANAHPRNLSQEGSRALLVTSEAPFRRPNQVKATTK